MKKIIYLDHAATTPIRKEVIETLNEVYEEYYGNPSSLHRLGQEAGMKLNEGRQTIANIFKCLPEEIIFTSGGTESDNLAIKGIAEAHKKGHIITSKIEHHAVLHTAEDLKERGFDVTFLDPDEYGMIHPETLEKEIRDDTVLVSIMYANNEVGTINPIPELAKICNKKNILFHTDAVQVAGTLDLDTKKLNVDALSISAHKFYGPRGVGVLYLKKGTEIRSQQLGGAQEFNKRASTENLAGILGMAKALELANKEKEIENKRLTELRDYCFERTKKEIPDIKINGHLTKRLPNNINISSAKIEGESILLCLDNEGICVSTGSACTSESLDPSHVLMAMKIPIELAHSSLRLSLGKSNTKEDIDKTIDVLKKVVKNLREISPIK